jgi:hypothetical protein
MSKRRATEDPSGTPLDRSNFGRPMLLRPRLDPIQETGGLYADIPKVTMTVRQIRRHLDYLVGTAETGWKYGNKETVETCLQEVRDFERILPTRSLEDLEEVWYGQAQNMVDEEMKKIAEMKRTIKREISLTRGRNDMIIDADLS